MECPEPVLIADLVHGMPRSLDLVALEDHLNDCSRCAGVVAEAVTSSWGSRRSWSVAEPAHAADEAATPATVAAGPHAASPTPEPTTPMVRDGVGIIPPGTRLGRYRVRRWLGRGGMGEVYEGYDPELDRRVALKLLRTHSNEDATAQRRLGREAKTLARLSSPNVVSALDVGVFGGQLFLVMELVEGPTLAAWLMLKPRAWREVLDIFLAAGEGVAAAHEVGVIHRDFKPQNVLIGSDGKPRVSDFGLARETGDESAAEGEVRCAVDADAAAGEVATVSGVTGAGGPALTRTGMVIGTPRYMAPEQFLRRSLDARVDQFSFCVALYEALYGGHPFTSQTTSSGGGRLGNLRRSRKRATPAKVAPAAPVESLETLRTAVLGGRPMPAPRGAHVPHAIASVLRRGLARNPDDRYPTLRQLLLALRRASTVRKRRIIAAAGAAVALLAAAGAAIGVPSLATRDKMLVQALGTPQDWSSAPVLAAVPETIHCLHQMNNGTLRMVWGSPRRAEDIDIATGARRPTNLDPISYRHGCPSLSPDGQQLLFEGYDPDGRPHIFHAQNPTGAGAKALVSSAEPTWSSEPRWLSSGRAFVFDLDLYHPAVFDMQSNGFSVVSDRGRLGPDAGAGFFKNIDRNDRIVITESSGDRREVVNVYRWPGLTRETTFEVMASGSTGWVSGPGQSLFGAGVGAVGEGLGRFDAGRGAAVNVATIPGKEMIYLSTVGEQLAFATRAYTSTLWFRGPSGTETALLNEPSIVYFTASMTSRGDVLLSRSRGTKYDIVMYRVADKTMNQVTEGPDDYTAAALPDGDWILGRNESRKGARPGIFRCSDPYLGEPHDCRRLASEFAVGLAASPSGKHLAYVAADGPGTVLRLMSLEDGTTSTLVRGATGCHPVWSSPSTLWVSTRTSGEIRWTEYDITQRRPTGQSKPGTGACFEGFPDRAMPVVGPLRIETTTAWDVRVHALP